MSLAGWQRELVGLLVGDDRDPAPPVLTRAEARWIEALPASPGFLLTVAVQREWRRFRVRSCLPLTVELLGERFDTAVAAYLDGTREPASFFLREAERFVECCRSEVAVPPHFDSVSRFELAMVRGAAPGGAETGDVIAFHASPAAVLGALLHRCEPPPAAPCAVAHLVCAGGDCHLASADEVAKLEFAPSV